MFFGLFVDGINRCGAVITLEGRDFIQRDLDVLERWGHTKLMTFNKAKHRPALVSLQSKALIQAGGRMA